MQIINNIIFSSKGKCFLIKTTILLLLFICFTNIQGSNKHQFSAKDTVYREKRIQLLQYYFGCCPDSFMSESHRIEVFLDSLQDHYQLINLYSLISEFYQYRTKDYLKAMHCLTNAVNVMSAHPEINYDNPYLFVNIGNILFQNNLYTQAINSYRQALTLAVSQKNNSGIALVYHNIGLSFQNDTQYDSARIYFRRATRFIPDTIVLLKAQQYYYISHAIFISGHTDAIPIYHQKIIALLDQFISEKKSIQSNTWTSEVLLYHKLYAETFKIMASCYLKSNEFEKCENNCHTAIKHATMAQVPSLKAEVYFLLAESKLKAMNLPSAIQYGDSALTISVLSKDYKAIAQYSGLLATLFMATGNTVKTKYFRNISAMANDSLIHHMASAQLKNGEFILGSIAMDLAIQNLRDKNKLQYKEIGDQRIIIALTFVLVGLALLAMALLYLQNRKLKRTQISLSRRTFEVAKAENYQTINKSSVMTAEGSGQLLIRLENLMNQEKIFMNSNLKLKDLADRLDSNQTYLSQLINQNFDVNFNDYINNMRVKEVCHIILNNTDEHLTIDHLYGKVGFVSKSVFYTAFRRFTGVTPAVYIQMNHDKEHQKSVMSKIKPANDSHVSQIS